MSQLELQLERFLSRRPEVAKCYRAGLINRRALARYLIRERIATASQFDAVVATLRRHDFGERPPGGRDLFREVRIGIKDNIVLWDLEKDRTHLERLERLIARIDFEQGDTLKIVVGTASIKLLLDRRKEAELRSLFERARFRERFEDISEVSLMFPAEAVQTPGVVSTLTQELFVHDVVITEILTATPELLLYVTDDQVSRAYAVIRSLRDASARRG
jgi:hypothetical protein